jgi:hypothetical protein
MTYPLGVAMSREKPTLQRAIDDGNPGLPILTISGQ